MKLRIITLSLLTIILSCKTYPKKVEDKVNTNESSFRNQNVLYKPFIVTGKEYFNKDLFAFEYQDKYGVKVKFKDSDIYKIGDTL